MSISTGRSDRSGTSPTTVEQPIPNQQDNRNQLLMQSKTKSVLLQKSTTSSSNGSNRTHHLPATEARNQSRISGSDSDSNTISLTSVRTTASNQLSVRQRQINSDQNVYPPEPPQLTPSESSTASGDRDSNLQQQVDIEKQERLTSLSIISTYSRFRQLSTELDSKSDDDESRTTPTQSKKFDLPPVQQPHSGQGHQRQRQRTNISRSSSRTKTGEQHEGFPLEVSRERNGWFDREPAEQLDADQHNGQKRRQRSMTSTVTSGRSSSSRSRRRKLQSSNRGHQASASGSAYVDDVAVTDGENLSNRILSGDPQFPGNNSRQHQQQEDEEEVKRSERSSTARSVHTFLSIDTRMSRRSDSNAVSAKSSSTSVSTAARSRMSDRMPQLQHSDHERRMSKASSSKTSRTSHSDRTNQLRLSTGPGAGGTGDHHVLTEPQIPNQLSNGNQQQLLQRKKTNGSLRKPTSSSTIGSRTNNLRATDMRNQEPVDSERREKTFRSKLDKLQWKVSQKVALERLHQAVLGQDEERIGYELTAIREKHPELCESTEIRRANQLMRIHKLARELKEASDERSADGIRAVVRKIDKEGFREVLKYEIREAKYVLVKLTNTVAQKPHRIQMDRHYLNEIRHHIAPPLGVLKVMQAVLLLLGEDEGKTKTWEDVRRLCKPYGPQSLYYRVINLDVETVPPELAARSRQILLGHSYQADGEWEQMTFVVDSEINEQRSELDSGVNFEKLKGSSPVAGTLYVWALGVINEVERREGPDKMIPADIKLQKRLLGGQVPELPLIDFRYIHLASPRLYPHQQQQQQRRTIRAEDWTSRTNSFTTRSQNPEADSMHAFQGPRNDRSLADDPNDPPTEYEDDFDEDGDDGVKEIT